MGVGRKGEENLREHISCSFVSGFVWTISTWVHMGVNVFVTLGKKKSILILAYYAVVIEAKSGNF